MLEPLQTATKRAASFLLLLVKGYEFSPEIFNLYNEAFLRELVVLSGFITDEHNLNDIKFLKKHLI